MDALKNKNLGAGCKMQQFLNCIRISVSKIPSFIAWAAA